MRATSVVWQPGAGLSIRDLYRHDDDDKPRKVSTGCEVSYQAATDVAGRGGQHNGAMQDVAPRPRAARNGVDQSNHETTLVPQAPAAKGVQPCSVWVVALSEACSAQHIGHNI
jgi:hypothetical protein